MVGLVPRLKRLDKGSKVGQVIEHADEPRILDFAAASESSGSQQRGWVGSACRYSFDGIGHPQPADMSLDFVIDVDASGRVAKVGSDYIEILL